MTKKIIGGIPAINPIIPINPSSGYNGYQNSYLDNRQHKQEQEKQQNPNSNQDGDYFEKSNDDAEYMYTFDGTFMETRSNMNMKRLVKKEAYSMSPITDRSEGDCRTMVQDLAPMYAIDDNSYMNYVNQNPKNKYIMKMRGELPPEPEIMTLKDYNERYFEDDGFTLRTTPKAATTEKRLVRKADDSGSSSSGSDASSNCDSGSSINSDGYGNGIYPSSPTVPYYTPEYLKKRKELMDTQQKQRSPQDRKNDTKKPFKEVLKDQLRMFYD